MLANNSLLTSLKMTLKAKPKVSKQCNVINHDVSQHQLCYSQLSLLIAFVILLSFWVSRRLFFWSNVKVFHWPNLKLFINNIIPLYKHKPSITVVLACQEGSIDENQQQNWQSTNAEPNIILENNCNVRDFEHGIKNNSYSNAEDSNCRKHQLVDSSVVQIAQCPIQDNIDTRQNISQEYVQDNYCAKEGAFLNREITKAPTNQNEGPSVSAQSVVRLTFDYFLNKMIMFGFIMIYIYLCDYYKVRH